MVNISSSILSSMMEAFGSIISNNLNVVLKFLTSVTNVLSIPTNVTSFLGMNDHLLFQDHALGATFIAAIFLVIAGVVVFLFTRRDWFQAEVKYGELRGSDFGSFSAKIRTPF
jgi:magnesium transporter